MKPKLILQKLIQQKKLDRTSAKNRANQYYKNNLNLGETLCAELLQAVREKNFPILEEKLDTLNKMIKASGRADETQGARNIYGLALNLAADLGFLDVIELLLKNKYIDVNRSYEKKLCMTF